MTDLAHWAPLMGHLVFSLPLFTVCIIGLVLAIMRWEKHPNVSLLVILACGIDLLAALAGSVTSMLPLWVLAHGASSMQLGMVTTVVGVVLGLVRVGAIGLMLAAALSGRGASPSAPSDA